MMINKNGPMPSFTELQMRYDQKTDRKSPLGMRISKELDQTSEPKLVSRSYQHELPKSAPGSTFIKRMNESFLKRLNSL